MSQELNTLFDELSTCEDAHMKAVSLTSLYFLQLISTTHYNNHLISPIVLRVLEVI